MAVLRQKHSSYGFELLQIFNKAGITINEGTLYPLLNRMFKNGWLDSNWEVPVDGGHPRRFYRLSNLGKKQLIEMLDAHQQHNLSLEQLQECA